MVQPLITRSVCHTLFTIVMYGGVFIFLFPYLSGKASTLALFVLGAAVSILAGACRCYFTEGGCADGHHPRQRIP
jgi:hypothetical protein